MNSQDEFEFDFFVSRCGAAASVASEAVSVLEGAGYRVKSQDFDFDRGGDFVGDIHDALVSARHLYILHTEAYDRNYWTRKEFTNFLAAAAGSGDRRVCVLRCDEAAPRGILANVVFGDIVGVADQEQRRKTILDVARGEALQKRRDPRFFGGSMPTAFPGLVGRDAVLNEVVERLRGGASVSELRIVALVGLGGVGKTATARCAVDRLSADYLGVWWIPAETRATIFESLAMLAERLDPRSNEGGTASDVESAGRRALRRLEASEAPYLLVFDNLDDQSLLDVCLPARGAHVLLTSRRAEWFGRAHEIRLDALSEEEAAAFLQLRASRKDEAGARRLARALGCLPLALDHAGAYVKLTMMSFDAYAARADALVAKAPKGATYPTSLAATFTLAIDNAAQEAPAAIACMQLFSLLGPDDIPLELCDGLVDEESRFEAVASLIGVSLIRAAPSYEDEPRICLHRLVQAVFRARMRVDGSYKDAASRALAKLAAAFPSESYDNVGSWPICAGLLPHALALCENSKSDARSDRNYIDLCVRTSEYLHARASFEAASSLYREAFDAAHEVLGADAAETSRIATRYANSLRSLGRLSDAEPLLRGALATEALEMDDRAAVMTSLAEVLYATNRAGEAEALLRNAVAIGECRVGRNHPDVAIRLNNLARMRQDQGDLIEAESLFREALAAGIASLGKDHPLVGDRQNNLAKLLHDLGRFAEAEALYREAIAAAEKMLDPLNPKLAVRRQNLANLLRDTGRASAGVPLYRAALEALGGALPADHPDLARVTYNLASALDMLGLYEEAGRLASRAAAVHTAVLGVEHPWTAQSSSLAERLAGQGAQGSS